jgi:hypothetical protein
MAYYCGEYDCIVHERPCPHCGDSGHQEVGALREADVTTETDATVGEVDA